MDREKNNRGESGENEKEEKEERNKLEGPCQEVSREAGRYSRERHWVGLYDNWQLAYQRGSSREAARKRERERDRERKSVVIMRWTSADSARTSISACLCLCLAIPLLCQSAASIHIRVDLFRSHSRPTKDKAQFIIPTTDRYADLLQLDPKSWPKFHPWFVDISSNALHNLSQLERKHEYRITATKKLINNFAKHTNSWNSW